MTDAFRISQRLGVAAGGHTAIVAAPPVLSFLTPPARRSSRSGRAAIHNRGRSRDVPTRGGGLFTAMKISSGERTGSRLSRSVSTSEKCGIGADPRCRRQRRDGRSARRLANHSQRITNIGQSHCVSYLDFRCRAEISITRADAVAPPAVAENPRGPRLERFSFCLVARFREDNAHS